MTPADREQLFERVVALQNVNIDHALERGRNYLMERLQECRQKTDEIGQIAVRVKQAIFKAKIARREAIALSRIKPAEDHARARMDAEAEYDELKALEEAVNVCRSTLRSADSDIRLAGSLLGVQIGLGQFRPAEGQNVAPSISEQPATTTPDPVETTAQAAEAPVNLTELLTDAAIDPRDAAQLPVEAAQSQETPKGRGSDTRPASTSTVLAEDDATGIDLASLIG